MRLKSLFEDHWQPISNHPGQLGKLDKRAKKNDKSFLVHPEDRKRWLKWFGGGKKIKEDLDDKSDMFAAKLDDKDEFGGGGFQRQELINNINKLRYIAASSENPKHRQNAATLLKSMEKLYQSQFGEPYNQ